MNTQNAQNTILDQIRAIRSPLTVRWSVGSEPLEPELPDLETLQKWVADGTTVRIEYTPPGYTVEMVGPSPVTCKLLQARDDGDGPVVRVSSGSVRGWNMFLDPVKGSIGVSRPLVTSITPVAVAQTPEEIDTIMQAAAKSGARVEAVTASGLTCSGTVRDDGTDGIRYRIPAFSPPFECMWLGSRGSLDHVRVVSVRELAPEKQTEAEMLALLQAAERDGNHVEATMCDGSKLTGEVSQLQTCASYHLIPSGMVRVSIGEWGASFGAHHDRQRIAAVKLLPREEKRPVVQTYDPSKVTVTFSSPMARALGIDGPFSLADIPTLRIKVDEKTHITPTCCADVAPYIGRRVRVEDGIEGILTGCGIDDDGDGWFGLDGETPHNEDDRCYTMPDDGYGTWTFELLPDEPAPSANLLIEPKVPADLEPYIGRRVRVLAGEEREVVSEGRLLTVETPFGSPGLTVEGDDDSGWYYGPSAVRSTLVEVLPELQGAEPDDCDDDDLEDDDDDAVSAGSIRMWETPVLRGVEAVAESVESERTTLWDLVCKAPDPRDGLAYAAYHHTVAAAIAAGLVTA